MPQENVQKQVIADTDLRQYFQASVSEAISDQGIDANVETAYYLVNLLTSFVHTENLYEHTPDGLQFKPLAHLYSEALESRGTHSRCQTLKRMGDVALFVAGVFSYSLRRKLVDVDYYIAMGGNAYAYLSATHPDRALGTSYRVIFSELSEKFSDFVDVLARVSSHTTSETDRDILRLYELWVRTGSKRAAQQLRHLGIEPALWLNAAFDH